MGMPVVFVANGGLPVTRSLSGFGLPVDEAGNGFGVPVTFVAANGLPVLVVPPSFVPNPGNPPDIAFDFTTNRAWRKDIGLSSASSLITVTRASSGYVNDSAGNWTSVGNNLPRWSDLGLLMEETRTNSVANNSLTGLVAGSPGTLPNGWSSAVLAPTTLGAAALINGIDTFDVLFSSASAQTNVALNFTPTIAALQTQTWAGSVFLALVSGNFVNVSNIRLQIIYRNGGGTAVQTVETDLAGLSAALTRVAAIGTATDATTASFSFRILFTATGAYNFGLRIGWPQAEQGTSITSPIRTTTVAVTRATDVIILTTPGAFGAAYTDYSQGTPQSPNPYTSTQNLAQIDAGLDAQRLVCRRQTNAAVLAALVGGTGGNFSPVGTWTVSSKMVAAVAAADQAAVFNGGAVATNVAAVLPTTPTVVRFGSNASSTELWNGFVTARAIWRSQRVPNSQLQSMTA